MNTKKIGLCSANSEFTRKCAKGFHAQTGIGYIVFAEIACDYIAENIAKINEARAENNLQRIILPAIDYIRNKHIDAKVILLDMEVLMHDEAVAELKKDYSLVMLQNAPQGMGIEHIMHKEYIERLEKIADIKTKNIEEIL